MDGMMYAEEGDWVQLSLELKRNGKICKAQDEFGMTILHWACTEPKVPLDIFRLIVAANPAACRIRNQSDMLPIHVALTSPLPGMHLDCLLQACPDTSLAKDAYGHFPSEIAAETEDLPEHSVQLIKKMAYAYANNISSSRKSTTQLSEEEHVMSRVSEFAMAMDNRLPRASSVSVGEVSDQLKDLVGQLRQLQMEFKHASPRSTVSTVSTSSSVTTNNSQVEITWTPGKKLGISFEPMNSVTMIGAVVKRFTDAMETEGIDALKITDVLYAINGNDVSQLAFDQIVECLQKAKSTQVLTFQREEHRSGSSNNKADQEEDKYTRMSMLLEETMRRVSEAEDTVRMSVAMSFAA